MEHLLSHWQGDDCVPESVVAKDAHLVSPIVALVVNWIVGMLNISLIEIQIQKAVKRQVTRDECLPSVFDAFLVL